LFLAPFFAYLPRVVMSAIIIIAAYSLLELHDLIFLWKVKAWKDLTLLVFTFLMTVIVGVDLGIFIGMGISLLLVVRHTSFPRVSLMGQDEDGKWKDAAEPKTKPIDGLIVVRIEEALYFANIEQIKDMFKRIEMFGRQDAHFADETKKGGVPTKAIIIHAKNIQDMDASAMQVMVEMIHDYEKRHIFVCFVKLKTSLLKYFFRAGILNSVNGDRIFQSMEDAVKYIKVNYFGEKPPPKEPTEEEKKETGIDGAPVTTPDSPPTERDTHSPPSSTATTASTPTTAAPGSTAATPAAPAVILTAPESSDSSDESSSG